MLVTSMLSFSHKVFQRFFTQAHKKLKSHGSRVKKKPQKAGPFFTRHLKVGMLPSNYVKPASCNYQIYSIFILVPLQTVLPF